MKLKDHGLFCRVSRKIEAEEDKGHGTRLQSRGKKVEIDFT